MMVIMARIDRAPMAAAAKKKGGCCLLSGMRVVVDAARPYSSVEARGEVKSAA